MQSTVSIRYFITFCLFVFLTGCGGEDQPNIKISEPLDQQSLEGYIASQNFSGSVYIAKSGQVLLNKGFGFANRNTESENTPDTKFRIGSLTKQFTAVAILSLMEQGLLQLDDYVIEHINDFPHGDQITIKQLLTHTSGLANYTELSVFEEALKEYRSPNQLITMFKNLPLEFTPGSQFSYSNSGYIVLGAIIEKLSGMSYQDYLTLNVFEPLNMLSSDYGTNEIANGAEALGYKADGSKAGFIDMSIPFSAGALVSTVNDLAKWDQALYDNALLNAESTALMFTPSLNQYALGWSVTKIAQTSEPIHVHGGNILGFSSVIIRFPQTNKLIVVLSNIQDYPVNQLAVNLNNIIENE